MRAPCAALPSLLLLACCAAPQRTPFAEPAPPEVVADSEPLPEGDYVELMIAAIDAYERDDYFLAEGTAIAALRLRPDDELASDVLDASRRSRHGTNGCNSLALEAYVADKRREFAGYRAELCPHPLVDPVAREEPVPDGDYNELVRAGVDAFCREEFELAETHAAAALRLRPDDPLASDLLDSSRRARHTAPYRFLRELKERYRKACDALDPPASPTQRADYVGLMVAALDAFCEEDFDVAEDRAGAALRVCPGDKLASDVIYDGRQARHSTGGKYYEEMMARYRSIRAGLAKEASPPAPP